VSDDSVVFYAVENTGPVELRLPTAAMEAHGSDPYDAVELGVYSRLRSYPGVRFFGLQEHLDRTDQSQRLLGIVHKLDHERLRRAIQEVTAASKHESTFVRFDLLSSPAVALGTQSPVLISVAPFVSVPQAYVAEGVGVAFSDLVRKDPLAKRAIFVRERGGYSSGGQDAYERLLRSPKGDLLEGSSSNFFGILDGALRMAPEGVLQGVTQRFCVRLAHELVMPVQERPIHTQELSRLDEAFLTSSSRGVVPIVCIEGQDIGRGVPGPWTLKLHDAYAALAERNARAAWPLQGP